MALPSLRLEAAECWRLHDATPGDGGAARSAALPAPGSSNVGAPTADDSDPRRGLVGPFGHAGVTASSGW
eukprot:11993784-Alexandrium_andersonii.AAC.1